MKKMFIFVSAFVLSLTLVGCSGSEKTQKKEVKETSLGDYQVLTGGADVLSTNSIEDIEKRTDYIVSVKFNGDRKYRFDITDGDAVAYETSESIVRVTKSFKGDLKPGKEIKVFEPGLFVDGQYVNFEGYNVMEKKGKYVLFLEKGKEEAVDGYVIVGMQYGKYDMEKADNLKTKVDDHGVLTYAEIEDLEYFGEETENFYKIKKQVREKYKL